MACKKADGGDGKCGSSPAGLVEEAAHLIKMP